MAKPKIVIENKSEPNSQTASEIKIVTDQEIKNRRELKSKIGEFLLEKTLEAVGGAKSPIAGEKWKSSLSKEYAKRKKGQGALKANMELSGDMLDSLKFKQTEEGVMIGIFKEKEAEKADGHCKLTGRKNPFLKEQRRFLPDTDQKYKSDIMEGIDALIAEHVVEKTDIPKSRLQEVTSQSSFNELVKEFFPAITLPQAKQAMRDTPEMFELLRDLGLLRFLL